MAETARLDMSDLSGTAADLMSSAVDGLSRGAETQKNAGADAVAGFAHAFRQTADELEAQSPQIARVVRSSAEAADRFSRELQSKDIGELLHATTQFARQRPYLFLGLGIAAGAILARAIASSR